MARIKIFQKDLKAMSSFAKENDCETFFIRKNDRYGAYVGVEAADAIMIFHFKGMDTYEDRDALKNADFMFGRKDKDEHFDIATIHRLADDPQVIKMSIIAGFGPTRFYSKRIAKVTA